ncbi:MAG TPA: ABC transporter permease [Acidobacteriaceae bacterium]|nr:ABC transporter permease [Acidobacteriaceae bacterium]
MTGRLRALANRIAAIFGRRDRDADLDEELRAHIEMAVEENRQRGMSEEAARRTALRSFGGVTQTRERFREQEGLLWFENFRRETAYALRQMRRSPGFTAVVIVTLALGIGANAAVFSVLNAVMLKPLAFRNADRLVQVLSSKNGTRMGPSPPDMRDFAAQNHTFMKLAVYDQWRKNVSTLPSGSDAEEVAVGLAPPDFFQSLGVEPILGRLFTADEGVEGHNHVALITDLFWQSHYQRDPRVLGRTITINDEPYTIVGVIPATIPGWLHSLQRQLPVFEPFLPYPGIWDEQSRDGRNYGAIGLLKPGVSLHEAQADLARIAGNLAASYPVDRGFTVALEPLASMRSGDLKPLLMLLMGAVALVLLIACANLAALLLARNTARKREFAMRRALGASRSALVRQVLAETLVFSLAGSAFGLAIAGTATRTLSLADPARLPQLADLTLDWRVLAFTLLAGIGTCLLFGIAPAWLSSRVDAASALKDGGRSSSAPGRHRFRRALVTAQIALSLMLLVAAGLLLQTLHRLQNQDLGLRIDHLARGHLYLPPAQYPTPQSITGFCDRVTERLRTEPGVQDVSVTTIYPPSDSWRMNFSIVGHALTRLEDVPSTIFGVVDANYLGVAGIPVVEGRDFADSDREQTVPVAVVNQTFVRRYFPGEDPIGRRIELGAPASLVARDVWMGDQRVTVTVAGVMRDNLDQGLAQPVAPQLIALYRQVPAVNFGFKEVLVRTEVAPDALVRALQKQVQSVDPRIPLAEVEPMSTYLGNMTAVQRFTGVILAGFAALGLGLAVMGIYGVIAYLVAERTREIGIRLALGASRRAVLWLVSQEGIRLALAGAAMGMIGVVLGGRSMASLLYRVSAFDALTLTACSLTLIVIAWLACVLPARRAAKIDPMQALRQE